jgi:hypothetical protein
MKLFGYHLRKDGCWREVPQMDKRLFSGRNGLKVLQLLFEWPWQKKDPRLKP